MQQVLQSQQACVGAQTHEIFFSGIPLSEGWLLFRVIFCGDSSGFAVASRKAGVVTEEGIMTGDCSVVSMASLNLILEVSNSVLIAFFTLCRYLAPLSTPSMGPTSSPSSFQLILHKVYS